MFSHVRRSPVGRYFTSIQRKEARVFKVNFKVITVYKLDVSKMVVVFLMCSCSVFTLYLSSLRVAMGVRPTAVTLRQ